MTEPSMARYYINAARIKYHVLHALFKDVTIDSDVVNLYIDLHAIFYRMYRNDRVASICSVNESSLVMDIVISTLNTIGHYRRYIATHLKKSNRIFLFFNRKLATYQTKHYADYAKNYYDMYSNDHPEYSPITKAIKKAFKLIAEIVPYLEGIYLVDNRGIDSSTAINYFRTHKETKEQFNIIFSRNLNDAQMLTDENQIMLYNNRDDSFILRNDNALKKWIKVNKRKIDIDPDITPNIIPFFLILSGDSTTGMKSKYCRGISTAAKVINKMWNHQILSEHTSVQMFIDTVWEYLKGDFGSEDDRKDIKSKFMALNIPTATKALSNAQKMKLESNLYDLYDVAGLESLNEDMIEMNPESEILDLYNLSMSIVSEV